MFFTLYIQVKQETPHFEPVLMPPWSHVYRPINMNFCRGSPNEQLYQLILKSDKNSNSMYMFPKNVQGLLPSMETK